jgi:hypothetical protein
VEVLLCPDELHLDWGGTGNAEWTSSFQLCGGSSITILDRPPGVVPPNGISPPNGVYPVRMRDVTDGVAYTAMVSERRFTPWYSQFTDAEHVARYCLGEPAGCVFNLGQTYLHGEEAAYANACADPALRMPPRLFVPSKNTSLHGQGQVYDHLIAPNRPSCKWYVPPKEFSNWSDWAYSLPASSYHGVGVNLAYADGRGRFVSNYVDEQVWRAIGSRNGNESIQPP